MRESDNMRVFVYHITNISTGKIVYVGRSICPKLRWYNHRRRYPVKSHTYSIVASAKYINAYQLEQRHIAAAIRSGNKLDNIKSNTSRDQSVACREVHAMIRALALSLVINVFLATGIVYLANMTPAIYAVLVNCWK